MRSWVPLVPLLHMEKVRVEQTINHAAMTEAMSSVDRDVAHMAPVTRGSGLIRRTGRSALAYQIPGTVALVSNVLHCRH